MSKRPVRVTSPASFLGVNGSGIISFGSGQPDLPPPKQIFKELGVHRLFRYGLIQGDQQLRQLLSREYPHANAQDFVITNGASEALDLVFRALYQLHGRIKILMGRPYYYSYPALAKLAGHQPVFTELVDGRIDLKDFKNRLKGVKAILINSPSNPTGRIESLPTLREIERLAAKAGIYIISDEVYKDLIYQRENYLLKGKHVITVNSFSKTYSMCGLRVGYLYSRDPAVVKATVDIKVHSSMNTNILGQEMALRAMSVPRSFIERQRVVWEKRRDYIYDGLVSLGFKLWKPEGAFYVLPKIKHSEQVVSDLYYRYQVIVYDGAWFGAPGHIRLSYALDQQSIKEGLARIATYVANKPDWLG